MTKKIRRKTHKITKNRIFKDFRKKHLMRKRIKLRKNSVQETLEGKEHNVKLSERTSRRRSYRNFSRRSYKIGLLKKSVVFLLIGIVALFTINAALSNINSNSKIRLNSLIANINVQNFKNAFNNVLPIINVTYNSGNIGNPISVQIKALIKNIFGFDIGIPLTILNAQSSFLQTYYEDEYIPYLAEKSVNDEKEYFTEKENVNSNNNAVGSSEGEYENQDDKSLNSGDDIASRGDNRNAFNRGDNIEEVEGGLISYYYYEGEEEKLEEPKENISKGQKINILNMTNYKIVDSEINKLLNEPLNFKLDRQGPGILILHTHSSESFVKTLNDVNVRSAPISSRDPQENVVRVGHELAEHLKKYGFNVIHNGTEHDIPDHNKSYNNSYETIEKYLKSYPTIKVVLDIHRDGLSKNQPKLRVATNINGKNVAQIMFVVGTNANGLEHSKWKENLKLALKLQDNLNSQYPGIARHIYISNNRYNQHFTSGSLIIEVGGEGNLLSECLESTKYLAKAISEVIK